MAKIFRSMTIDEVSLVDKGASGDDDFRPQIRIVKFRRSERKKQTMNWKKHLENLSTNHLNVIKTAALANISKEDKPTDEEMAKMTLEDILAMLPDEAKETLLALMESMGASVDPTADVPAIPESGDTDKRLAKLEQSQKLAEQELRKATQENHELRKQLAYKAKREEIEGSLDIPGDLDDLTKALIEIDEVCSENTVATINTRLKSFSEVVKDSKILKTFGTRGAPEDSLDVADAVTKRDALVKELRNKDSSLTVAQARVKVYRENPAIKKALA